MMLKKVIIRSNCTDQVCEKLINETITEYPNNEIEYEMLIESTLAMIEQPQKTLYTLMIRIEAEEGE